MRLGQARRPDPEHQVDVVSLDSTERRILSNFASNVAITGSVAYAKGHLLFVSGTRLMGEGVSLWPAVSFSCIIGIEEVDEDGCEEAHSDCG